MLFTKLLSLVSSPILLVHINYYAINVIQLPSGKNIYVTDESTLYVLCFIECITLHFQSYKFSVSNLVNRWLKRFTSSCFATKMICIIPCKLFQLHVTNIENSVIVIGKLDGNGQNKGRNRDSQPQLKIKNLLTKKNVIARHYQLQIEHFYVY